VVIDDFVLITASFRLGTSGCGSGLAQSGLASQEGVAVHLEGSGPFLAAGSAEGVDRRPHDDVDEAGILEDSLPACAQQASGNSAGP
jgi:hypothetical protein